jgi:hypothetical protein
VKVDHHPAPGGLMQPIDILREEHSAPSVGLEPSQGVMGVVGKGMSEPTPADHAARPIAGSDGVVRDERLKAHRLHSLPAAIGVPIVGYPGVRAAAGIRKDKQSFVALDECFEVSVCHFQRYVVRPCPRFHGAGVRR